MLRMLVAWDTEGNVVQTLHSKVERDSDGAVLGLTDFEATEKTGGRLRDVWNCPDAVGSGTWPEWLGVQVREFRVELDPAPRGQRAKITALVHKSSGHRRERAAIEAAVAERVNEAKMRGGAADLRDLLGGPGKPIRLDAEGRTLQRAVSAPRPALPYVAARKGLAHPRQQQPNGAADDLGDVADRQPEEEVAEGKGRPPIVKG